LRNGELVLLDDQERSLWDRAQIASGRAALERALAMRGRGPYVLQAAIASLHTQDSRDWPQILELYSELARITDSPVVALNRAVALAQASGAQAGLDAIEQLADLDGYRYFHAARADLLRRLERPADALLAYERALELARSQSERSFLAKRIAGLRAAR
jgi:RNA polymerase sigma-70 factor (ECF subfamily)